MQQTRKLNLIQHLVELQDYNMIQEMEALTNKTRFEFHSAWLNGKKLKAWKFSQKELIKRGKLVIERKDYPSKTK